MLLQENGKDALYAANGLRHLKSAAGSTISLNYSDPEAPIFGTATPTTIDLASISDGDLLVKSNTVIVGTTSIPTMVVTNLVSPFGQLLSTGNATNYTIDFNTSDKQSITATGNVAFLTINNISNGAMKRFYITNVFWGTSNINVLMPTNCLVVTTNSGGPAAIGGGGSTNWVMTVTNDAKLSIECHGTTMRQLVWYLRLLQP